MSSKQSKSKASAILEKSGWTEGKGLGRDEQGDVSHVKVQQKDGNLGIGYNAQVSQVWSQQSVAFADVLSKFGGAKSMKPESDDDSSDDDDEAKKQSAKPKAAAAGKHSVLYDKRRKLKTEGLNCEAGKGEILAHAASGRRRQRDEDEDDDEEMSPTAEVDDGYKSKKELKAAKERKKSGKEPETILPTTLTSPLLRRMCERCGTHEPKKRGQDDPVVNITIPDPKPPKATVTPFKYQKGE